MKSIHVVPNPAGRFTAFSRRTDGELILGFGATHAAALLMALRSL